MKEAIKSNILNLVKEKQKISDQLFEQKVSKFYKILRDQSLKVIDKDTKMRFDKVFSHLLKSDNISEKLLTKDIKSLLGEEDNDLTEEEIKIILLY
jgi:16S rRNA A1518/A1519 N6-dimethyltransferase RsmA/KsgA/DIM1 with predicted DNA glycosylase/AP lyase activity